MSDAERSIAQMARTLVLLALLLLLARPHYRYMEALRAHPLGDIWWPWGQLLGVAAAFIVVSLVGRRARQGRWVLAFELVVAVTLAIVPGPLWSSWLGTSHPVSQSAQTGFLQPLSLAWAGVAVSAAVAGAMRRRRAAHDHLPEADHRG